MGVICILVYYEIWSDIVNVCGHIICLVGPAICLFLIKKMKKKYATRVPDDIKLFFILFHFKTGIVATFLVYDEFVSLSYARISF